jgi:hypothetical protein
MFYLSFRFLLLPRRFAAMTPFPSFVGSFFGAFAFVSHPPVVARFELAGDVVSIKAVAVTTVMYRRWLRGFAQIPWRLRQGGHPSQGAGVLVPLNFDFFGAASGL